MEERILSVLEEKNLKIDNSNLNVYTFHSYALENIDEDDILSSNVLRYAIFEYLKELETWSKTWRLCFAQTKCSYSIYSKTSIEKDINETTLNMYNLRLKYESSPKFLGITFDKNLNFRNHVDSIKKLSVSRLNILKIFSYGGCSLTPTQ